MPTSESHDSSFLGGRVLIGVADITQLPVDAIVNAANASLLGGGGVDGAIHRAGGPRILEECREIRRSQYPQGLPAGEAIITTGGNLPALHVIHTVGPVYGEHNGAEAQLLAACYENSLKLAASHSLASIGFPAISTGAFRYPRSEAAAIASQAVKRFLAAERSIETVRLVFFSESDKNMFLKHQQFV